MSYVAKTDLARKANLAAWAMKNEPGKWLKIGEDYVINKQNHWETICGSEFCDGRIRSWHDSATIRRAEEKLQRTGRLNPIDYLEYFYGNKFVTHEERIEELARAEYQGFSEERELRRLPQPKLEPDSEENLQRLAGILEERLNFPYPASDLLAGSGKVYVDKLDNLCFLDENFCLQLGREGWVRTNHARFGRVMFVFDFDIFSIYEDGPLKIYHEGDWKFFSNALRMAAIKETTLQYIVRKDDFDLDDEEE